MNTRMDNLTIEVQGSSDNAASALDKIIAKIDELQAKFDKAAPSVSKFAEQMEKIASSSRQWSSFDKMASSVDKQAQASKKAEANMAMYDARLQRANVSLERSRAAHEKLVASMEKMSSVQKAIENNNAAFSMSPEEHAAKYDHTNNGGVNLTPEVPGERQIPQLPQSAPSALASDMLPNLSKTATINVDTSQAQSAVAQLGEFINGLNPDIANMSAEAQARFGELSEELMRTGAQMDNLRAIYHNLAVQSGEVAAKSGESSDAYLRLEKRMLSTAASADRLGVKQEKLKSEMSDLASSANSASASVSNIGDSSTRAATQAESGLGRVTRMAQNMFLRIAMFRIFSAVQQGIVTGIQNMALASGQANVTMSALSTNSLYLKNSLAAAAMPAIQAMIPALNQMTNALADAFNAIGMLTARIFNHASSVTIAKRSYVDYAKTINQSSNNSAQVAQKEAENQAKAAEKASKAHDAAAKKQAAAEERVQDAIKKHQQKIDALKKSIMGFDELNVLKDQTDTWEAPKAPDYMSDLPSAASYNTAAAPQWNGMQSPTTMFETVPIPAWVKKVGSWTDKIAGLIQDNISVIHRLLVTSPFVIGAVLAFSGANIPLGVALMAIGAVEIGKQAKLDWDYLSDKTKSSLEKQKRILQIVGAVELVIGAILAFSGANVPLGIALMIGGITTTAATLNWDSLSPQIKRVIGAFTFTGAVVMLALGTIFMATGHFGVGIGLLVGGATAMWGSAALNWGSMDAQLKGKVSEWTIIASGALFGLGTIMLAAGHIGLGIGMIIGGIVGVASTVALNGGTLSTQLKGTLSSITAIVGTFSLALGAALVFLPGASTPVGIALLALGAASLITAVATNNNIISWIQTNLGLITLIAGGALLAIGLIMTLSGGVSGVGIALLAAGAVGLITSAVINKDAVINFIVGMLADIVAIAATASLAIGLILCLTGAGIPLGILLITAGIGGLISAPKISKTALTDKVQEALDGVKKAFSKAWEFIKGIWKGAGPWFGDRWNDIKGAFSTTGKWFQDTFGTAWSWVQDKWKGAGTWFGGIWDKIKGVFKPNLISDAMGKAWTWTQDKWKNAGSWFGGIWGKIKGVFKPNLISDAMGKAWTWTQDKWKGAGGWFGDRWNDIVGKFKPNMISDTFKTAWSNVQTAWNGAPDWFHRKGVDIANNIAKAIYGAINSVIGAINWVLGKVGSKTHINPLTVPHYNYARGTGSHPGGAAIVNDAPGSTYRELVQLPTGKAFIPKGRNVLIPNLPRGSKVLPAKETHTLFPHYAGGIGAFFGNAISSIKDFGTTMWKYISEPKKLFQLAVDKFVNAIHINEPWLSLGNSAVKFVTNHVADALKGIFAKFSPPSGAGGYGVDRWSGIATQALHMTGQYSSANLSRLLMQMQSESGGNPYSINKWDSNWTAGHPSKGLMQLIDSTFRSYAYPGYGSNIYDPLSNILASIRYTVSRYGSLAAGWKGHGYANGIGKIDFAGWNADGGLFVKPALAGVGEAGPEAALPLNDDTFSKIAQGIVQSERAGGNGDSTQQIINRMDKLEQAIKDIKVYLYTDDRKIAESANRGNHILGRMAPTA